MTTGIESGRVGANDAAWPRFSPLHEVGYKAARLLAAMFTADVVCDSAMPVRGVQLQPLVNS